MRRGASTWFRIAGFAFLSLLAAPAASDPTPGDGCFSVDYGKTSLRLARSTGASRHHLVELFEPISGHCGYFTNEQQRHLRVLRSLLGTGESRDANGISQAGDASNANEIMPANKMLLVRVEADFRNAATLKLALPGEELLAAKRDLDLGGPDNSVWVGEVLGQWGIVLVVQRGAQVHGVIQTIKRTYRISPLGGGLHVLWRVVDGQEGEVACRFGQGLPDAETGLAAEHETDLLHADFVAGDFAAATAEESAAPAAPPGLASTRVVVDVLVAYTDSAAALVPDIEGHIALLIAWANVAYENSKIDRAGIDARRPQPAPFLRLAATLEVGCSGCEDRAISNSGMLQLFAGIGDGRLDEVHARRNAAAADVCVLMTGADRADGNGLAMAGPPRPETAFCLVETRYSIARLYIVAHEIGHLQDAQHQTGTSWGKPYARGYCQTGGEDGIRFWTIMCTLSNNKIPYWSNPAVTIEPEPGKVYVVGTPDYNNARRLNETSLIVASHRGRVVTPVEVADLAARGEGSSVRLTWTLPAPAPDELAAVDVQRAEAAGGPYLRRTADPLLPRERMVYDDRDVDQGHTYWYRLVLLSRNGDSQLVGPVEVAIQPWRTRLHEVVAVSRTVQVRYSVGPWKTAVQLGVFDVRGRLVRMLDRGARDPGEYRLEWDRRSASGAPVPRGVYLVRLRTDTESASSKLVLPGHDR